MSLETRGDFLVRCLSWSIWTKLPDLTGDFLAVYKENRSLLFLALVLDAQEINGVSWPVTLCVYSLELVPSFDWQWI